MAFKLTIQRKLLAFSLMGAAFVAIVGTTGYSSVKTIAGTSAQVLTMGLALKSQLEADQSHDALRGDVLAAYVAGYKKDAAAEAGIKAELAAHVKVFRESLQTLESLPLEADLKRGIAKVKPALEAYVQSAGEQVDAALKDTAAADVKMPAFQTAFKALETEMAALSDQIETQAKVSEEAGAQALATARVAIFVSALVAAVVFYLVGLYATRSIVRPIRQAVAVAQTVASGDLRSDIAEGGQDETGELLQALRVMNDHLVNVVNQVRLGSDSIATGSAEIAAGSADLSQRTEEQASSLQQTAASMEQLTGTVKNSAATAQQASRMATGASEVAARGGAAVRQVVGTMEEISSASKKINDIIGVIDGIAFQTNILALNAAVEAARAGEQGRGFAVVASEVRSLAQRSAQAAKEIKALIGASVERVEAGSQQVGDAGRTMEDIVSQVSHVSAMIGEISAATSEQTQGIGQVSQSVALLDQVTQQNAALVEESAAASESLRHQADKLVQAVSAFRLPESRPGQA